jgi:two-component system cell cycle sensor histidine kinase/response regulator CckA
VEAVAAFEANPGSFRAAVVDMTMPEMDGVAVIGRLRTGRPDFPVLICSGHGVQEVMNRVESDALLGFLPKPYAIDDFQSALKQLLGD